MILKKFKNLVNGEETSLVKKFSFTINFEEFPDLKYLCFKYEVKDDDRILYFYETERFDVDKAISYYNSTKELKSCYLKIWSGDDTSKLIHTKEMKFFGMRPNYELDWCDKFQHFTYKVHLF